MDGLRVLICQSECENEEEKAPMSTPENSSRDEIRFAIVHSSEITSGAPK